MVQFIKSWVSGIAAVVVILAIFETLMPSGRTKKYISLVIGLVMTAAIAGPLVALKDKDFTFEAGEFRGQLQFDRAELEAEVKARQEEQREQIIAAYKAKLVSEINAAVGAVDGVEKVKSAVNVREEEGAEDFGAILNIYIAYSAVPGGGAAQDQSQAQASPTPRGGIFIPKVTVGPSPTAQPDEQTQKIEAYKALKSEVASRVSVLFSIEKSKITIARLED